MKKIITTAAIVLAGMGLLSAPAFAAEISNTGPGSDNSITDENSCNSTTNNDNDVDVNNGNSQGADSGNAGSNSNTTGGGANSGNADNSNSNDTDVDVTNGANGCGCACTTTTTPTTPTTPVEPPVGGQGGEVLSASTTTPVVLAETGPGLMSTPVVASIVLVGSGAALVAGAATVRRFTK